MVEPHSYKVEATVSVPVVVYVDARYPEEAEAEAEGILRNAFDDFGDFEIDGENLEIQDVTACVVDSLDGDDYIGEHD